MYKINDFSGKAEIYSKNRPSYPDELFHFLSHHIIEGSLVADIGAGTGIFSKLLLENGYSVIAVEPNEEMGKIAIEILDPFPLFQFVFGTAENTGIKEHSIDLVTAAQAFHWFDSKAFKKECQRVLKKGGKVALIWNKRDESNPFIQAYEEINKKLCSSFKGFSSGIKTKEIQCFFKDENCEIFTFSNINKIDEKGFIGRALSSSYAPQKEDDNYNIYQSKLRELFKKFEKDGFVEFPIITALYFGEV